MQFKLKSLILPSASRADLALPGEVDGEEG